jgi:hypothetical protein
MKAASLTAFAEPAPGEITLSFGKHRGVPLADIESSYLEWVKTADRATPELTAAIDAVLATRKPKTQDKWRAPQGVPAAVTDMARLLIEAGARELGAALDDWHVGAAEALLKSCVDAIELESDPGTLPF